MSFPKVLDNARVLFYTPQSCYGTVHYLSGEIADHICYLAICNYKNDTSFYLFGCNKNYEVIDDTPWDSIEECMRIAQTSYNDLIVWIKMD